MVPALCRRGRLPGDAGVRAASRGARVPRAGRPGGRVRVRGLASVGSAWSMASGQATWLWPCRTPLGASASRLSWKGAASPWSAGSTAGRSRATRAPRAVTPTQSWPQFLRLYRSGIDFTSLRSWLGFGDWLPCAPMRFGLMATRPGETTVPEAVAPAARSATPTAPRRSSGSSTARWMKLDELLRACAGGLSLDAAVCCSKPTGMPLSPRHVELLGDDPRMRTSRSA